MALALLHLRPRRLRQVLLHQPKAAEAVEVVDGEAAVAVEPPQFLQDPRRGSRTANLI